MTNVSKTLWIVSALVAPAALSGCNRTPQEAHEDAVEAQKQADQTVAEAREEAVQAAKDAKNEAAQAIDDAREKAAEAQADANAKIREANREIQKPASEVEAWGKEKLDAVDNMIDEASAKAQAAKPVAQAKFNSAMEEVRQQREALSNELASLRSRAGKQLDQSKQDFSKRIDRVKDRIRSIEKTL